MKRLEGDLDHEKMARLADAEQAAREMEMVQKKAAYDVERATQQATKVANEELNALKEQLVESQAQVTELIGELNTSRETAAELRNRVHEADMKAVELEAQREKAEEDAKSALANADAAAKAAGELASQGKPHSSVLIVCGLPSHVVCCYSCGSCRKGHHEEAAAVVSH